MGSIVDSAIKIGSFGLIDTDVSGQKGALRAQQDAANRANETATAGLQEQRQVLQPWQQAGMEALKKLQSGNLEMDPGYQFRLKEGQKAIDAAANAGGRYNSGRTLKELTRYGQDYASNEYGNAFNRQNILANYGNSADTNLANLIGGRSATIQNNTLGLGNSEAGMNLQRGQDFNNLANTAISGAAMMYGGGMGGGAGKISTMGGPQFNPMQGQYSLGNTGIDPKYLAYSDMRLKTNIQSVSKLELQEMKKNLKALSFGYIDNKFGDGEWVGVMAQDLNKSKLGRTLTFKDEKGMWQLNLPKILSLFLATMAEG